MAIEKNNICGVIIKAGLFGAVIVGTAGLIGLLKKYRPDCENDDNSHRQVDNKSCLCEEETKCPGEDIQQKRTILARRILAFTPIFGLLVCCTVFLVKSNGHPELFSHILFYNMGINMMFFFSLFLIVGAISTLTCSPTNFEGPFWDGLDRVVGINKNNIVERE